MQILQKEKLQEQSYFTAIVSIFPTAKQFERKNTVNSHRFIIYSWHVFFSPVLMNRKAIPFLVKPYFKLKDPLVLLVMQYTYTNDTVMTGVILVNS